MPLKCSSLECDDIIDDALFRELYADAIERAVNNEKTAKDVPADSWADHPYYDDLGSSETDRGDAEQVDESPDHEHEIPWEDHPSYDDLGMSETGAQGDDDALDVSETDQSDDQLDRSRDNPEDQQESDPDDVSDTPDEREDNPTESDTCEEDVACQDHLSYTSSEVDNGDLAWEGSPYY